MKFLIYFLFLLNCDAKCKFRVEAGKKVEIDFGKFRRTFHPNSAEVILSVSYNEKESRVEYKQKLADSGKVLSGWDGVENGEIIFFKKEEFVKKDNFRLIIGKVIGKDKSVNNIVYVVK